MARRTVDLPDDLSEELERMSNDLRISQVGLLTIAGYSLVARYKTHGPTLFETSQSNVDDRVTLVESGITEENIQYVKDHIEEFGRITLVKVFGVKAVPKQYHVPTVDGQHTWYTDYRLILANDKGREWWFAGCACGYGGEGVRGTHQILTLLNIPFPFVRLAEEDRIMFEPYQDHTIRVAVSRLGSSLERQPIAQYELTFESAGDLYRFKEIAENLGYVNELITPGREHDDRWAYIRDIEIARYSDVDTGALKRWFTESLGFIVKHRLRGTLRVINDSDRP
ncbi:hypothetical protein [Alicyclobacillus macrosporangiidus]|uniref:Uncharacterized protein n=1 Tax=Alicyclobacillus macrosporangiidus TaxID=392015 RepID=A0A1I7L2V1_9BACL|nr:hypothetical protein [Alicyclobacillus macrosporangiidus]SFV03958.1 hypothetical protein SAMN05421543_12365 [Alicyclobacillus macrosporangiidus]